MSTLQDAITLAHHDRDGFPLNPLMQPPPTPVEAAEILRHSLQRCGFNWLTGVNALEVLQQHAGLRNIVIGGQGEAEANTFETPENAYARLDRVAEECGYLVGRPRTQGETTTITVQLPHGVFRLVWLNNVFARIDRFDQFRDAWLQDWPQQEGGAS